MKKLSILSHLAVASAVLFLAGCALPGDGAKNMIVDSGWQVQVIQTPSFDLQTAETPGRHGQTMWVYLEGDGDAYITPEHPAWDPTPSDPIGLRLALKHPGDGPVAYVARPCQYVLPDDDKGCTEEYWTNARYAPEVIQSTDVAIDALKGQAHAANVVLVGYAGGGSLAVLTAATRTDVIGIVTIASNLDLTYWTQHNDLSPLTGSRNPADVAGRLSKIPQVHFIGAEDKVVDVGVLQPYMTQSSMTGDPLKTTVKAIILPGYTHSCCWVENWGDLFRMVQSTHYLPFNHNNILP